MKRMTSFNNIHRKNFNASCPIENYFVFHLIQIHKAVLRLKKQFLRCLKSLLLQNHTISKIPNTAIDILYF